MAKKYKKAPRVQCLGCGAILISKSRHDFQQCKCENHTFVDGGLGEYVRYGGMNLKLVKVLNYGEKAKAQSTPIQKIMAERKLKYNSIGSCPTCHNCYKHLHVADYRDSGQTAVLYGEKHWLSRWECPTCGEFVIATPYPRV